MPRLPAQFVVMCFVLLTMLLGVSRVDAQLDLGPEKPLTLPTAYLQHQLTQLQKQIDPTFPR